MRLIAMLLLSAASCFSPVSRIVVSKSVDWKKKQVLVCLYSTPGGGCMRCYTPGEFSVVAPVVGISGVPDDVCASN